MTAPLEPEVWPACSQCGVAYMFYRRKVVDRAVSPPREHHRWLWERACLCEGVPFLMVNKDGLVETD